MTFEEFWAEASQSPIFDTISKDDFLILRTLFERAWIGGESAGLNKAIKIIKDKK
jgi:hypothetical protein